MSAPGNSAPRSSSAQPLEYGMACEASRQLFRQFQYDEADGPQEAFCKLWELCSQWLKPQTRSMEKILALLVLEQFLHILPSTNTETQPFSPEIRQRLLTLIEDLKRDRKRPGNKINMRDMLLEELMSMGMFLTQSDTSVSTPELQIIEPVQNIRGSPPQGPQQSRFHGDGQNQTFLNIEIHFSKKYELEPPGKEPPEQLLADSSDSEETQMSSQQEIPGSSRDAQPSSSRAPARARPSKKPNSGALIWLCFAHWKQYNAYMKTQGKKVAPGGPRGGTGSDTSGQQLLSQELGTCEHAVRNDPSTEVTFPSVSQEDYFHDERQQCRLCKNKFMFHFGLREIVRNRTDSKPYQCSFCGKLFRRRSHVTAHLVKHTKERPFTCEHCQKTYKHKSSLLRHLKFHTRNLESNRNQASQSLVPDAGQ